MEASELPSECGDGICSLPDETNESCRIDCGCGNGIINPKWEICDDGNTVSGDGCSDSCFIETSGSICIYPDQPP